MKHLFMSLALFCAIAAVPVVLFGFPVSQAWEPAVSESPVSTLSPVEIGWIVGSSLHDGYGIILHTTDGGENWVRQGSAPDVPDVDLYAVWAADAHYAWVVGEQTGGYGVILRTTDGGLSWQRQGNSAQIPNVELFGVHGLDRNTLWVVGTEGTILHTADGGQTWTQQTGGTVPVGHYEGIWAIDRNHVWAGGGEENTSAGIILRTTDGGLTWERKGAGVPMFDDGFYVIKVYGADKDTAWAVGHGSMLAHTADGGETWDDQSLQSGDFFDTNGVFFADENTGWVARDNDTIWATQKGGAEWASQTSPSHGFYLLRVHALDDQKAWMVGNSMPLPFEDSVGVALHTENGGSNWYTQTVPVTAPLGCVWFVDNRLHSALASDIHGTRITYTMAISSPSPQANLVVSGSIPVKGTFASATGGEYIASGGDYGRGYVTSPSTVTLQVGQTYYLIWALDLPQAFIGHLENQAHARSDSAPSPVDLTDELYQLTLPVIVKDAV